MKSSLNRSGCRFLLRRSGMDYQPGRRDLDEPSSDFGSRSILALSELDILMSTELHFFGFLSLGYRDSFLFHFFLTNC